MFSWLYEAAQSATQLVCFGLWCAGCVVALRHRPRPGATLAAAGFGILALLELVSLAFYLTFVLRARIGSTVAPFSDVFTLFFIGVQGILHIAGVALLVAGVSRAWISRDTEPILRPCDAAE